MYRDKSDGHDLYKHYYRQTTEYKGLFVSQLEEFLAMANTLQCITYLFKCRRM